MLTHWSRNALVYSGRVTRIAWAYGLTTTTTDGRVLDAWFPEPALGERPAAAAVPPELTALTGVQEGARERAVRLDVVLTEIDLDAAPANTPDAYLRLHLLSHRLVQPHGQNLDGIFGVLPNVVWTSSGPCAVEGFERTRGALRHRGTVQVLGVDKFPRMTDYVVPTGVRIADASRVRLGAHLAEGTTVMHEGFVNYNAGTLGASMVEDASRQASSSTTARTSVAAHRSWGRCRAAASSSSGSARAA